MIEPVDLAADLDALARYAEALAAAVDAALAGWVVRCVVEVLAAQDRPTTPSILAAAQAAGEAARTDVGTQVRALLAADIAEQTTNPLALVRAAVRYPTAVLAGAGAMPVERDEFAVRAFPADVFGLSPATFADLDPAVAEPGLVWGAAKAHVHLRRRRTAGD